MSDNVKVRRTWRMDPVERVHSRRKKPTKADIPAKEEIEQQLQEWYESEWEGWTDELPDIDNLHIKN